ncbi:MAG: hypothetical protein UX74_C0014G0019 [Parcubacteria group bacterium GW2011_GWA2_47_10b]|nr:MAG: hypothetical protein UX74_C0014G0019 [Parcubacteria group bacterium GW2011_GWA2_47_10b]KKU86043.1 MAG: hypothetical protein UY14_C0008G0017 [Parcubacteria group bacterium GW2011_GWA1_47_9]
MFWHHLVLQLSINEVVYTVQIRIVDKQKDLVS